MNWDWVGLTIVLAAAALALLPFAAYLVGKFWTAGCLAARRFFNNREERERDERQRRRP